MQREEAVQYLGLKADSTEDDIIEAIENQLFSIRDYFLRQPVIPVLYRSRIQRLLQLAEVTAAFNIPLSPADELPQSFDELAHDALSLYRTRELRIANCRGLMAKRLHLLNCVKGAETMLMAESAFERDFQSVFSFLNTAPEPVKAAERPDSVWVIDRLKSPDWQKDEELISVLMREKTRILANKSAQ